MKKIESKKSAIIDNRKAKNVESITNRYFQPWLEQIIYLYSVVCHRKDLRMGIVRNSDFVRP